MKKLYCILIIISFNAFSNDSDYFATNDNSEFNLLSKEVAEKYNECLFKLMEAQEPQLAVIAKISGLLKIAGLGVTSYFKETFTNQTLPNESIECMESIVKMPCSSIVSAGKITMGSSASCKKLDKLYSHEKHAEKFSKSLKNK